MLDANAIATITFDLDDTLWEIGPVIERAERRLRDWLGENYPDVVASLSRERIAELRDAVFAEHGDRAHDFTFLRREIIRRMGEAAGSPVDVDAAFEVFLAARNDLDLYPDVRPVLTSLAGRFTLVAVTNGNADLDRIGIADLFDGFVSARSVGSAKPAPEIFAAAVEIGGSRAQETLHVGDHPELDVHGARAAGLRAVWMNRAGHAWPRHVTAPDGIVQDLHGLESLLGRDN